jgi:hypothetical protein
MSGGDDEPAKATAVNTKTMAEHMKQVAETLAYMRRAQDSGDNVALAIARL